MALPEHQQPALFDGVKEFLLRFAASGYFPATAFIKNQPDKASLRVFNDNIKLEIVSHCWPGVDTGDNPLHKIINQLRRALGDSATESRYIETIRKRGYRTLAEVRFPVGHEASATTHIIQRIDTPETKADRRGLAFAQSPKAPSTCTQLPAALARGMSSAKGSNSPPERSVPRQAWMTT